MKKILLLPLLVSLALIITAQSSSSISGPDKDLRLKKVELRPNQVGTYENDFVSKIPRTSTQIGTTWYDGQALNYGNMMQRTWAYPDGSLGAIWLSSGQDLDPERGCGYNYYDGADWGTSDPHVGPADRMGTPSYAPWGPNGEIITQYRYPGGEPGPLKFFRRETKGTGDWIETELFGPDGLSLVWQSIITSGEDNEHIHLLAFTYDAPYQGQEGALLYYRSSDGTETWDIDGVIIEGLGSDYYETISSLSYAWANPVGETIAFNYGFDQYGGKLFKSENNGDDWEIIDVYTTPFSSLDQPSDAGPFGCGMGSSAVALDSDGDAHVVWARMRWDWAGAEAHYYPFTDGLIYWNESMAPLDTTIISAYTLDFLEAGGNLIGSLDLEIPSGQPTYYNALWGFPQISIDSQDNIFVATSTVSDYTNPDDLLYRHIFVNSSFNGGETWEGQVDLNDGILYLFSECAFPAMAPVIDDKVHIVYQEDNVPGIHEWANEHDIVENKMKWMSYDKDFFVGVDEEKEITSFSLSEGYPNPASETVSFSLNLKNAEIANVRLTNIIGQVVQSEIIDGLHSGANTISLNVSDLMGGVYFCTIEVNNISQTSKIIIR